MKVRITPILEHNELVWARVLVSSFKVIEDNVEHDGVPSLDTLEGRILSEIKCHSITPTSFGDRTFETGLEDQWYEENYQFKGNEVVRFGINCLSEQVKNALSEEGVMVVDTTSRAESTAKSSGRYTKDDATQINLTSLENVLLSTACNNLLAREETRSVLVDIFARVNGGPMKQMALCQIFILLFYTRIQLYYLWR